MTDPLSFNLPSFFSLHVYKYTVHVEILHTCERGLLLIHICRSTINTHTYVDAFSELKVILLNSYFYIQRNTVAPMHTVLHTRSS